MAEVRPIENDEDLRAALERMDVLWRNKDQDKQAGDELKVLTILVEDYERRTAPIPPPTPLDAIRFRMDQLGLKTIDLAEHMGTTRARASEVLHGKRQLTLPMIRRLVASLQMDAATLIGIEEKLPRLTG